MMIVFLMIIDYFDVYDGDNDQSYGYDWWWLRFMMMVFLMLIDDVVSDDDCWFMIDYNW